MAARVTIIGAGLAGLSAAIGCAKAGVRVRLYSNAVSERAQSVLAEGGINAALDTMGEDDNAELHFRETYESGCHLADMEAVRGMTEAAPELVKWLASLGVPFHREDGRIVQRFFGGQSKRRSAYIKSGTGKALMTALIDEVRRYECEGLIERFVPWELYGIEIAEAVAGSSKGALSDEPREGGGGVRRCEGVRLRSAETGEICFEAAPVIICTGGLAGLLRGRTTGSLLNDGSAAAMLFAAGVRFSNLEMLQYHPTTIAIAGKRLLVTEAARGEGGRLYILREGKPYYFMEERYPERGNLMPRDVVSREIYRVSQEAAERGEAATVYLDLTGLSRKTFDDKLSELRDELIRYLGLDPLITPIPVSPGIHYFMGGIDCDARHRTNVAGLYAAGECTSLYHGANRLGGNSLLGAIYGGRRAAETAVEELGKLEDSGREAETADKTISGAGVGFDEALASILYDGLPIMRSGEGIEAAIGKLEALSETVGDDKTATEKLRLGEAMLRSAALRCESRGAHFRTDYPETDESLAIRTVAEYRDGVMTVGYADISSDEAILTASGNEVSPAPTEDITV